MSRNGSYGEFISLVYFFDSVKLKSNKVELIKLQKMYIFTFWNLPFFSYRKLWTVFFLQIVVQVLFPCGCVNKCAKACICLSPTTLSVGLSGARNSRKWTKSKCLKSLVQARLKLRFFRWSSSVPTIIYLLGGGSRGNFSLGRGGGSLDTQADINSLYAVA